MKMTKKTKEELIKRRIGAGVAWINCGKDFHGKPQLFEIQFALGEDGRFRVGPLLLESYLKDVERIIRRERYQEEK